MSAPATGDTSGDLAPGLDPGPRGGQIRGLGLSLRTLLLQFHALSQHPTTGIAPSALTDLVERVEHLSLLACAYGAEA